MSICLSSYLLQVLHLFADFVGEITASTAIRLGNEEAHEQSRDGCYGIFDRIVHGSTRLFSTRSYILLEYSSGDY